MRKFSLMIAALALVLGTTQCSKQDSPLHNGEKQHVVLTANNGNHNSKVAAEFASDALNLTWEGTESIVVSGGATGVLEFKEGVGETSATFAGDVTKEDGSEVTFRVGNAPASFEGQTGTEESCKTWIQTNIHLEGKSEYKTNGKYEDITMELQYAVLKLDLSAFADDTKGRDAVTVTISADGETVATVTSITSASTELFVAMPAADSREYTFSGNGMIAQKTWQLEPNFFYTKAGETGGGTGASIKIDAQPTLTLGFGVTGDGLD